MPTRCTTTQAQIVLHLPHAAPTGRRAVMGAARLSSGGTAEAQQAMYHYAAHLVDVIDADTLKLQLDLGFSVSVKVSCRLARVNATEISTLQGLQAKAFVHERLSQAINLEATTAKADKYGRWLVELTFEDPQQPGQRINLSDLLLTTGNASPYKP